MYFTAENSVSQDFFTARARLAGAIESLPRRTPGGFGTQSFQDDGTRLQSPPSPGVRLPGPDGVVLARPTPAPGNSGPLTLRAGSGSGGRRRSDAAFPGFPHPVRLCWIWGLTVVVPGAAEPLRRLCRKTKVPAGRKDSSRRPASFRLRQSPGGCRARPIEHGCSAGALPPRRGPLHRQPTESFLSL